MTEFDRKIIEANNNGISPILRALFDYNHNFYTVVLRKHVGFFDDSGEPIGDDSKLTSDLFRLDFGQDIEFEYNFQEEYILYKMPVSDKKNRFIFMFIPIVAIQTLILINEEKHEIPIFANSSIKLADSKYLTDFFFEYSGELLEEESDLDDLDAEIERLLEEPDDEKEFLDLVRKNSISTFIESNSDIFNFKFSKMD